MSERSDAEELMRAGDYSRALSLIMGSSEPLDAMLRIRCRIGDRGYVRLCDKSDILNDIRISGDPRTAFDILSEYASPDPDVFTQHAVDSEVSAVREAARRDIDAIVRAVSLKGDLGAASLKSLCDSVTAIYRNHPLFPDLLADADMWDVVRFRNYLHTLDVTCPVNGEARTPEALYVALSGLRDELIKVREAGCDLSSLSSDDLRTVEEYGKSVADRKYPLKGMGKLTNRSGHDSLVEEYARIIKDVGKMIAESDRMRERICTGVVLDAWDFRES